MSIAFWADRESFIFTPPLNVNPSKIPQRPPPLLPSFQAMDNDWSKTGEQSRSDTNRKAVGVLRSTFFFFSGIPMSFTE